MARTLRPTRFLSLRGTLRPRPFPVVSGTDEPILKLEEAYGTRKGAQQLLGRSRRDFRSKRHLPITRWRRWCSAQVSRSFLAADKKRKIHRRCADCGPPPTLCRGDSILRHYHRKSRQQSGDVKRYRFDLRQNRHLAARSAFGPRTQLPEVYAPPRQSRDSVVWRSQHIDNTGLGFRLRFFLF